MRVVLEQHPVDVGAGVALVGVADHVLAVVPAARAPPRHLRPAGNRRRPGPEAPTPRSLPLSKRAASPGRARVPGSPRARHRRQARERGPRRVARGSPASIPPPPRGATSRRRPAPAPRSTARGSTRAASRVILRPSRPDRAHVQRSTPCLGTADPSGSRRSGGRRTPRHPDARVACLDTRHGRSTAGERRPEVADSVHASLVADSRHSAQGRTTRVPDKGPSPLGAIGHPAYVCYAELGSTSARPEAARRSVSIGRVAGIDIRVHASFPLSALFLAAPPRSPGVVDSLLWLVVIFACVVVHELAHCVGGAPGSVVHEMLLPIGGVSKLEHLPDVSRAAAPCAPARGSSRRAPTSAPGRGHAGASVVAW